MKRSILIQTRMKKKLAANYVAEKVGIVKSHYAKIEKGTSNPSLNVACKLEKLLGVPVCELLKKDGDED